MNKLCFQWLFSNRQIHKRKESIMTAFHVTNYTEITYTFWKMPWLLTIYEIQELQSSKPTDFPCVGYKFTCIIVLKLWMAKENKSHVQGITEQNEPFRCMLVYRVCTQK